MKEERDLLSHVSETREALRLSREARKAFEANTDGADDVLLRANWVLAKDAYTKAKQKLDAAVNDAIGLFKD